MKTLLVDGSWNLKRNFHRRKGDGGEDSSSAIIFGFLDSIRVAINKILPDRVVVMWDGFNSGKLRYDVYKPYKANRKKNWDAEYNAISTDGIESPEDKERYEIALKKEQIKEFLDAFCIRHLDIKYIEADDLIAHYVLSSQFVDEEIFIYSRDKDFLLLVNNNVSVLSPDNLEVITINNFKSIYGYTVENALLFKCFSGDVSDKIDGVKGVTVNALIEHFPLMSEEKYTYNRLVEECYNKKREKKIKFFDKIINARAVLYRNAKLMNLNQPFINDEVKVSMINISQTPLKSDFSIKPSMSLFVQYKFSNFVKNQYVDLFFAPFYRIITKEKEYSLNLKNN